EPRRRGSLPAHGFPFRVRFGRRGRRPNGSDEAPQAQYIRRLENRARSDAVLIRSRATSARDFPSDIPVLLRPSQVGVLRPICAGPRPPHHASSHQTHQPHRTYQTQSTPPLTITKQTPIIVQCPPPSPLRPHPPRQTASLHPSHIRPITHPSPTSPPTTPASPSPSSAPVPPPPPSPSPRTWASSFTPSSPPSSGATSAAGSKQPPPPRTSASNFSRSAPRPTPSRPSPRSPATRPQTPSNA